MKKKGYDVLLRAFALLPKHLNWRFEHIGAGEQQKAMKALAAELGIADRIEWRGALAQTEVLERYRSSEIFALACRIAPDGDRDGLPNVLVEASSQRLVCVSTDVSGVPELLKDGENGFVVPPEDSQALAAALETAIRNPAMRRKLGDAAEERVRREFDHNTSIRQLKTLFENEWKAA